MDFTIEKDELLSTLSTLSKINPTRTTLPILSTVLIQTKGNTEVNFRTTDLEIEMETKVSAKVLKEGEVCAPIFKLLEISNTINEKTISISVNEAQRMRVNTETGKYVLMCNKTEEFPDERQFNEEITKISTRFLKDAIQNTTYACSKDELKPTLNGVLFNVSSTSITTVATDGHRLVKYIAQQENTNAHDLLIPQKFLNIIGGGPINTKKAELKIYKDYAKIEVAGTKISTRLISEKFPDYENVIPKENQNTTKVETKNLLDSVKKVSLMSNKTTKQVVLQIQNNKINILAEDHDTGGSATDEIQAQHTGDTISIGFNGTLLLEILKHQKTEKLNLLTSSPLSATIFKQEGEKGTETTTLLMPIRI